MFFVVLLLFNNNFVFSLRYDDKDVNPLYDLKLHKANLSSENEFLKILDLKSTSNNTPYFFSAKNVLSVDSKLNADYISQMWTTYYGKIVIGTNDTEQNTFNILFDTGSSEFWLLDDSCVSSECQNHKRYHRSKDWTPKLDNDGNYVRITIKYLSGDIKAVGGTTSVNLLNGVILKDVNLGLATSINIPIFDQVRWDGILGLGFVTDEMKSRGSYPIFEAILRNKRLYPGLRCQFAYYVSKNDGNITFGGINPLYKRNPEDNIAWSPVNNDSSYWMLNLKGVSVRTAQLNDKESAFNDLTYIQTFQNKNDVKVIIDTGTYLIYAPKAMSGLLAKLRNNICDNMNKMPVLIFTLRGSRGNDVILELKPEDYILKYKDVDGKHKYVLGIVADDQQEELGITAWTFGEVFLRAYYTVYDYETREVGFVPSKKQVEIITNDNFY